MNPEETTGKPLVSGPDCGEIRPLLSSFADGEATVEERARVQAHLAGCAACESHLAFLKSFALALHSTPEAVPSAALFHRIAQETYRRPTLADRVRTWLAPASTRVALGSLAAAGLVAVLVVPRFGTVDDPTRPTIEKRQDQLASENNRVLPETSGPAAGIAGGNTLPSENAALSTGAAETVAPPVTEPMLRIGEAFLAVAPSASESARPARAAAKTGARTTVRAVPAARATLKPTVSSGAAALVNPNKTMAAAAPTVTAPTVELKPKVAATPTPLLGSGSSPRTAPAEALPSTRPIHVAASVPAEGTGAAEAAAPAPRGFRVNLEGSNSGPQAELDRLALPSSRSRQEKTGVIVTAPVN